MLTAAPLSVGRPRCDCFEDDGQGSCSLVEAVTADDTGWCYIDNMCRQDTNAYFCVADDGSAVPQFVDVVSCTTEYCEPGDLRLITLSNLASQGMTASASSAYPFSALDSADGNAARAIDGRAEVELNQCVHTDMTHQRIGSTFASKCYACANPNHCGTSQCDWVAVQFGGPQVVQGVWMSHSTYAVDDAMFKICDQDVCGICKSGFHVPGGGEEHSGVMNYYQCDTPVAGTELIFTAANTWDTDHYLVPCEFQLVAVEGSWERVTQGRIGGSSCSLVAGADAQAQAGFARQEVTPGTGPSCLVGLGVDLSTGQPAASSGGCQDTVASSANDGDRTQAGSNVFQSCGLAENDWWSVQLSVEATNPTIQLLARDCCTVDYSSTLLVLIGPSGDWNSASPCYTLTTVDNGQYEFQCLGRGQYVFIMPGGQDAAGAPGRLALAEVVVWSASPSAEQILWLPFDSDLHDHSAAQQTILSSATSSVPVAPSPEPSPSPTPPPPSDIPPPPPPPPSTPSVSSMGSPVAITIPTGAPAGCDGDTDGTCRWSSCDSGRSAICSSNRCVCSSSRCSWDNKECCEHGQRDVNTGYGGCRDW